MAIFASCLVAACALHAAGAAAAVLDTLSAAPALRTDRLMAAEAAEAVPEADISGGSLEHGMALGSPLFTDGRHYVIELAGAVGTCPSKTDTRPRYMVIHYEVDGDKRDMWSSYVAGATDAKRESAFILEYHKEYEAYKIQHKKKKLYYGNNRYLAVHSHKKDDNLPGGEYRVIVHDDPNKAVLWDVWKKDSRTFIFSVKKNLAVPGLAEGLMLGTPPEAGLPYVARDPNSQYLAVVEDFDCTTYTKIYKY